MTDSQKLGRYKAVAVFLVFTMMAGGLVLMDGCARKEVASHDQERSEPESQGGRVDKDLISAPLKEEAAKEGDKRKQEMRAESPVGPDGPTGLKKNKEQPKLGEVEAGKGESELSGSTTGSMVVEDAHLYIRKPDGKVAAKKRKKIARAPAPARQAPSSSKPDMMYGNTAGAPLDSEGHSSSGMALRDIRPSDLAKSAGKRSPMASPPATPAEPVSPFARLKVVNDKPFHDMYFKHYGVNPTIDTEEEPFSTFSVDVDTASYTVARSYLGRGHLPEEDAIRVEEFVNAFDYGYSPPAEKAFGLNAEAFPSPNRQGYHVLHIGLKGKVVDPKNRKPANLVFVVDTSGSMETENRLGLVKKGLGHLVDQLRDDDTVGIVAYGNTAYEVLKPTSGRNKSVILRALNNLRSTGSTNAQAGIHMGYSMAAAAMKKGGINRVILCSDGVANNGIATGGDAIYKTVKDKADMGITISTIGFGMGNYNDTLMETLADQGDGNYFYVDREEEARRVFVENLTGMLQVIAKDVKIQVEFDKEKVSRYRLLGYENRALEKEDFANDKIDAGEIGAGHSVTAIYEVKFRKTEGDFGTLRVRYKKPEGGESTLIERNLSSKIVKVTIESAPPYARLSLVAAAFAEKLRGSYWVRNVDYNQLLAMSHQIGGQLADRKDVVELRDMIQRAKGLDRRGDKFEKDAPLALMNFDNLPVTR
ncbi:MAG: von Willebrand factor type A domain-containing protein [Nitrospinota bacterium]|nr:von Willebrand factor type A domain-containing protein [Nitrospinota bacterium]